VHKILFVCLYLSRQILYPRMQHDLRSLQLGPFACDMYFFCGKRLLREKIENVKYYILNNERGLGNLGNNFFVKSQLNFSFQEMVIFVVIIFLKNIFFSYLFTEQNT
jgi:hypothetical protein